MKILETSNIQLRAEKGISFLVEQSEDGNFIITAVKKVSDTVYSLNYVNPPVIDGYKHVYGEWYNGFVIERLSDKFKFVWIPVGSLEANGTLDGKTFNEKFGRRNYREDKFSNKEYHEPLTEEFLRQFESVQKYGGFYVSQDFLGYSLSPFDIHNNPYNHKATVMSNEKLQNFTFFSVDKVEEFLKKFETRENVVTSHLLFGSEYDSILEWILTSNGISKNPTSIVSTLHRIKATSDIVQPCNNFRINNIDNFAGDFWEITQERIGEQPYVVRGNDYKQEKGFPYIERRVGCGDFPEFVRIALWIK